MTAREDWSSVSDRLDALVLKLKPHLELASAADGVPRALASSETAWRHRRASCEWQPDYGPRM